MNRFILGLKANPSMSEKKSIIQNEIPICDVCRISVGDFLEPNGLGESRFILCANCEAMSECKDLYGAYNPRYIDAHSREGISVYSTNPRTTKVITSIKKDFQETEIGYAK